MINPCILPRKMPVKGVFLITLTTSAVLLNTAVLISLFRKRRVIPPYMILVMNLAVSDLCLALLGCSLRGPGMVIHHLDSDSTFTMHSVCKVAMFLYHPVIVSINNMVLLLTFDRFLAITRPLKHKIVSSWKFVKRAILVSWLISGLIIAINIVGVYLQAPEEDWYDHHFQRCSLTKTFTGQIVHVFNYSFFMVIPSTFSIFFYTNIVLTLRKRRSLRIRTTRCRDACSRPSGSVSPKSFITISIILLLYYMSYLPSLILRDIPAMVDLISTHVYNFRTYEFPSSITSATSITFYLSTFTDPIVYGIRSPYIFRGLKKREKFFLRKFAEKTSTAANLHNQNGFAEASSHDVLKVHGISRLTPAPKDS